MPETESKVLHRMIPGTHEQPSGPECLCGADWDRWNSCCTTALAPGASS